MHDVILIFESLFTEAHSYLFNENKLICIDINHYSILNFYFYAICGQTKVDI